MRFPPIWKFFALVWTVLLGATCHGEEGPWFQLFPQGRMFPPSAADPFEIRNGMAFLMENHAHLRLGTSIGLLGVPDIFRFGFEGGALFVLRQEGPRFPLETVDGSFGVFSEAVAGSIALHLRYLHTSAHLADGLSGTPAIFSRESLILRVAAVGWSMIRPYLGSSFIVNAYPATSAPLGLIGGFLIQPPWRIKPYFSLDLRWRQESQFNLSLSAQAGLTLWEGSSNRTLRVAYSYYGGGQIQGQFFGDRLIYQAITVDWVF